MTMIGGKIYDAAWMCIHLANNNVGMYVRMAAEIWNQEHMTEYCVIGPPATLTRP